MSKKKIKYRIDYYSAVHWLNQSLVLFCDIGKFDPDFMEKLPHDEFYQFFFTSYTDDDVRFMKEHFPDIIIEYSDTFDLWILCVDHWGTAWDGVFTDLIPDENELMLPNKWDEKGHATREWKMSKFAYYHKT